MVMAEATPSSQAGTGAPATAAPIPSPPAASGAMASALQQLMASNAALLTNAMAQVEAERVSQVRLEARRAADEELERVREAAASELRAVRDEHAAEVQRLQNKIAAATAAAERKSAIQIAQLKEKAAKEKAEAERRAARALSDASELAARQQGTLKREHKRALQGECGVHGSGVGTAPRAAHVPPRCRQQKRATRQLRKLLRRRVEPPKPSRQQLRLKLAQRR